MKFFLIFILSFQSILAQDINKFDSKGQKTGVWKGAFEASKRPKYQGIFDQGKEVGLFKFFDDTKVGTIIATREFDAKDNSCYTIFYNQNSNKVSEGKLINKLFEGEWKYYHENATNIMTTEFYKIGKLEGKRSVFFKDNSIAEEVEYTNGLRNGSYKKYSEKGFVLENSIYINGEFNGAATFRDPENNIVAEGKFKNGKKVGIWKFYEMGKLVNEENMSKPKKSKAKIVKK